MLHNIRWLKGVLAAAAIGTASIPAIGATEFYFGVNPPPPRYEILPVERPGYVWVPGYWDWRYDRWVWVRGHWTRERYSYYDVPRAYRDRDGDGVPNRYDRDRDGDGVPNRFDAAPNNPYYR